MESKIMNGTDNRKEKLTNEQKLKFVSMSPEVTDCVKMLFALFKDLDAKNFIRFTFNIEGEDFEVLFRKSESESKDDIKCSDAK